MKKNSISNLNSFDFNTKWIRKWKNKPNENEQTIERTSMPTLGLIDRYACKIYCNVNGNTHMIKWLREKVIKKIV